MVVWKFQGDEPFSHERYLAFRLTRLVLETFVEDIVLGGRVIEIYLSYIQEMLTKNYY